MSSDLDKKVLEVFTELLNIECDINPDKTMRDNANNVIGWIIEQVLLGCAVIEFGFDIPSDYNYEHLFNDLE